MGPDKEITIDNSEYDYENMDHETRLGILENQMAMSMVNFKVLGSILKEQAEAIRRLQNEVNDLKSETRPQIDAHFN